jgi:hypothetical protein
MKIKGEYRDILSRNGEVIVDTGWQSNVIVADYGRFLAALMKKDFKQTVGIDYMAVGSGSGNDKDFKNQVEEFFKLGRYLFCWDSVPGDGSEEERLLRYFEDDHNIVLTENAVITKPYDNIILIEDENLSATITLVEDEVKAPVKINDGWKCDLKVKNEDSKSNIYSGNWNLPHKPKSEDNWVWAKEIDAGYIKYLNPYLFSIGDGTLEDKLNSDIIPEELKEKFRTKGIPLSDTATVKKTENKWVITDEEKKYLIMKEGEKLNIYLCINLEGEEVDTVTNRLRIEVTFGKNEPLEETLEFEEFALLGIDKNDTFDTDKLFFINYVDHGGITKDEKMVLTRTIILTFPVEGKEEVVS